jgi:hypothetical protein
MRCARGEWRLRRALVRFACFDFDEAVLCELALPDFGVDFAFEEVPLDFGGGEV